MYIDKYNITVSGDKYNSKTKKQDHDVDVVQLQVMSLQKLRAY